MGRRGDDDGLAARLGSGAGSAGLAAALFRRVESVRAKKRSRRREESGAGRNGETGDVVGRFAGTVDGTEESTGTGRFAGTVDGTEESTGTGRFAGTVDGTEELTGADSSRGRSTERKNRRGRTVRGDGRRNGKTCDGGGKPATEGEKGGGSDFVGFDALKNGKSAKLDARREG